jgi:hypothetical protein
VTWPFWAMLIGKARGVRGVPATAGGGLSIAGSAQSPSSTLPCPHGG